MYLGGQNNDAMYMHFPLHTYLAINEKSGHTRMMGRLDRRMVWVSFVLLVGRLSGSKPSPCRTCQRRAATQRLKGRGCRRIHCFYGSKWKYPYPYLINKLGGHKERPV